MVAWFSREGLFCVVLVVSLGELAFSTCRDETVVAGNAAQGTPESSIIWKVVSELDTDKGGSSAMSGMSELLDSGGRFPIVVVLPWGDGLFCTFWFSAISCCQSTEASFWDFDGDNAARGGLRLWCLSKSVFSKALSNELNSVGFHFSVWPSFDDASAFHAVG